MIKSLAVIAITLFFCLSGDVYAADTPKQPTAQELRQAAAEATVIRAEYQRQLDAWTVRLVRIQDAQQALSKAAPKGKKRPIEPVKATSGGVKK